MVALSEGLHAPCNLEKTLAAPPYIVAPPGDLRYNVPASDGDAQDNRAENEEYADRLRYW